MKTAYEHGYDARMRGCFRVLCCPKDDAELQEWQRGWDDADMMNQLDNQLPTAAKTLPEAFAALNKSGMGGILSRAVAGHQSRINQAPPRAS